MLINLKLNLKNQLILNKKKTYIWPKNGMFKVLKKMQIYS
jgi:hypothetical protein